MSDLKPSNNDKLLSRLSPTQFAQVNALLDEALDLSAPAQSEWLAVLQKREPALAAHLEALLDQTNAEHTRTLDRPPHLGESPSANTHRFVPGQVVGLYTLESLLGRGGMSEVWRAYRSDGSLKRAVALKLPFTGEFDQRILLRFSRERDILARLNHPHIARLYDAGNALGQPYLAIELVEGVPIREYCANKRVGLRARVALLRQVLEAIQYAHTNLLVHRDIKPSNILVTAEGIVKLIDFGIAKPTEMSGIEDSEATQLTRFAGRVLTPHYASPEQIRGDAVSTSSDLFSLGVVLYELVTGLTPYASLRESATAISPPAREAAVLNETPTRPSVSPITQTFAKSLLTSPNVLQRKLADGLDAIVLTALAKEPTERYSTAQAFNDDLGAWLAGKPVRAQTPTQWYLLKKFIARHRLTVSLGAASIVAIFASAGIAIWEAKKASLAAQTTGEVKQFLVDMLSVNSGRKSSALSAQANRETSAEQLLKTAAKKMVDNPKIAPQVRNELLSLMGDLTYELHMNDDAAKLRTQRLATVSNPKDKAQAFLDLIDTYYQAGKTKEADEIVAQAKAFAPTVPSKIKTLFDARLLMREGRQLDFVGKHTQSTLLLAEASKALKAMSPAHEEWIEAQSHYLDGLRHTNPDATLSGYAALLESLETEHGASAAALIPVVERYAATLGMQQKVPEAKKIFDRLIALHTAHPDYDPMGATLAQADQASMLRTWGDFAAARPQLERALAAFEKAKISGHPGEPTTAKIFYAALLLSDWDFSKADKRFSEVERVSRTSTRPLLTASILEIRASSAMQQGRSNEARAWLTEALATRKAALPPSHMTFRLNEGRVIANEVAAGNIESALALYAQLRTFSVPAIPELPAMLLEGARIEGMTALTAAKKWTEFLEDSLAISSRPDGSPLSAQRKLLILVRRAEAHTELGQFELAMQSLVQADTLSNELVANALQPLRAQLALQKLATLARSKRSPEVVTQAKSDFLSQRALLKGESIDFKKIADQVMADLKRF